MFNIRTLFVTGLVAGCFAAAGIPPVWAQDEGKPSFGINRGQLDLDGHKYFQDSGKIRVKLDAVTNGNNKIFTLPITTSAPAQITIAVGQYQHNLTRIDVLFNQTQLTPTTANTNPTSVDIPATLKDQDLTLTARATYAPPTGAKTIGPFTSDPITVMIDITPPVPKEPLKVQRLPNGTVIVSFTLADTDLDDASLKAKDAFIVAHDVESTGTGDEARAQARVRPSKAPFYDSAANEIRFELVDADSGKHTITFTKLADKVGNTADATTTADKKPITLEFQVPAGRIKGEHIPYPENLSPGNKDDVDFNPGHKVETRTARLYYNRDAHRIAEIINRNTKRLNQSGVDAARRLADEGRRDADKLTDERRAQENLAIQAAQEARETRARIDQVEDDIHDARNELAQINRGKADLEGQLAKLDKEIEMNQPTPNQPTPNQPTPNQPTPNQPTPNQPTAEQTQRRTTLQAKINNATTAANDVDGLLVRMNDDVRKLRDALQRNQNDEIDARNKLNSTEAKEERARQDQFRREVAAGLADLDTYAAGDVKSIDPVTQVSITVAGEGVIHLRGPIKGINKIRRMINDLDAPVGQVKVGIHTVQINGEHEERMELVYEDIDKYIAHSRFLTNQAAQLFRKAVAQVATAVATKADSEPEWVVIPDDCREYCITNNIRDHKYLFAFFSSDFIAELCRMDSELIRSDNKLLSINSMDTMSLAGAMYVTALADNPIRMAILKRFDWLVACELPGREIAYYRALTQTRHADPCHDKIARKYLQPVLDFKDAHRLKSNAARSYHFPNLISFFESQFTPGVFSIDGDPAIVTSGKGTLNGVQYATLRMAQALKAQLVAELDFKNLVKERSLLERRPNEIEEKAQDAVEMAQKKTEETAEQLSNSELHSTNVITEAISRVSTAVREYRDDISRKDAPSDEEKLDSQRISMVEQDIDRILKVIPKNELLDMLVEINKKHRPLSNEQTAPALNERVSFASDVVDETAALLRNLGSTSLRSIPENDQIRILGQIKLALSSRIVELQHIIAEYLKARQNYLAAKQSQEIAEADSKKERQNVFAKRMLEQFIDEQEERSVELQEAMRSHASNVDNYLKRLAIALEDDVNAQFYNPAWEKIRRTGTSWDVNLGQIETTTILTNNRTFAKVDPQATFEFDLPKRDILITEAMEGAKALATDYGSLLQDSTFLAASSMLSGQPAGGVVASSSPVKDIPGQPGFGGQKSEKFGAALEGLIPDPSIYKFETGTGFEIRPVIQPDGHSIVYNFDYMYTTNVREPVRADEKHLGRVKRHYVHTDVQTSSYELREVSRYTVALKASRTDRGVPLLEDIPVAGILFRPLPSDESSLQSNIILASSTIYPTMYDLMGLRWSPYADEIGSSTLAAEKQEHLLQRQERQQYLRDLTKDRVNKNIGYLGHPDLPSVPPEGTKVEDIPPGEPVNDNSIRVPRSDRTSRDDSLRSQRGYRSSSSRFSEPRDEKPAETGPTLPPIPDERTGMRRQTMSAPRRAQADQSRSTRTTASATTRSQPKSQPRVIVQQVEFEPAATETGTADRRVAPAGYETTDDAAEEARTPDDADTQQRAASQTAGRTRLLRLPRISFGKR